MIERRRHPWIDVLVLVVLAALGMSWSATRSPAGVHYLEAQFPDAEISGGSMCSFGPPAMERWYSDRTGFTIHGVRPGMTLQEAVDRHGGPSLWERAPRRGGPLLVRFGELMLVSADPGSGVVTVVLGTVLEVNGQPALRHGDTTDDVAEVLGRGDAQGCRAEPDLRVGPRAGALYFQLESAEGAGR